MQLFPDSESTPQEVKARISNWDGTKLKEFCTAKEWSKGKKKTQLAT